MTTAEKEIVHQTVALLELLGQKPSIRKIAAVIEAAHGKRAMRWQTIAEAVKVLPGNSTGNTPATDGQQIDEASATPGQQSETATCASADLSRVVKDGGVDLDTNHSPVVPSPSKPVALVEPEAIAPTVQSAEFIPLFAVPEPKAKPVKAKRITSAYAGTALDSFGEFNPLVIEVLAGDSFKIDSKALEDALKSLAMWRAIYGDAAFAHGLRIAAEKGVGHRYVGGVAKRYDPDRDRAPLRTVGGHEHIEREDDTPTRLELVAAGLSQPIGESDIPPHMRPPWHALYRPLAAHA